MLNLTVELVPKYEADGRYYIWLNTVGDVITNMKPVVVSTEMPKDVGFEEDVLDVALDQMSRCLGKWRKMPATEECPLGSYRMGLNPVFDRFDMFWDYLEVTLLSAYFHAIVLSVEKLQIEADKKSELLNNYGVRYCDIEKARINFQVLSRKVCKNLNILVLDGHYSGIDTVGCPSGDEPCYVIATTRVFDKTLERYLETILNKKVVFAFVKSDALSARINKECNSDTDYARYVFFSASEAGQNESVISASIFTDKLQTYNANVYIKVMSNAVKDIYRVERTRLLMTVSRLFKDNPSLGDILGTNDVGLTVYLHGDLEVSYVVNFIKAHMDGMRAF